MRNKVADGIETIGAAGECADRLEANFACSQAWIIIADIRGITYEHVEGLARHRRQPVSVPEFDCPQGQPGGVFLGHSQCLQAVIRCDHAASRPLLRQCQRNCTTTGAHVDDGPLCIARDARERVLYQHLGVGTRDQHRGGDAEFHGPELARTHKVCDRLAIPAPRHKRTQSLRLFISQDNPGMRNELHTVQSAHGHEQQLRI